MVSLSSSYLSYFARGWRIGVALIALISLDVITIFSLSPRPIMFNSPDQAAAMVRKKLHGEKKVPLPPPRCRPSPPLNMAPAFCIVAATNASNSSSYGSLSTHTMKMAMHANQPE